MNSTTAEIDLFESFDAAYTIYELQKKDEMRKLLEKIRSDEREGENE